MTAKRDVHGIGSMACSKQDADARGNVGMVSALADDHIVLPWRAGAAGANFNPARLRAVLIPGNRA